MSTVIDHLQLITACRIAQSSSAWDSAAIRSGLRRERHARMMAHENHHAFEKALKKLQAALRAADEKGSSTKAASSGSAWCDGGSSGEREYLTVFGVSVGLGRNARIHLRHGQSAAFRHQLSQLLNRHHRNLVVNHAVAVRTNRT